MPVLAAVIGAVAVAFIGGVVWASDPRPAMRRTLREIRALPERVHPSDRTSPR